MTSCLRVIAGPGRDPALLFHIIYVSVNALAPHQRSRRREAIHEVRHVFLDADHAAQDVLDAIEASTELPNPSYVLWSSPGRAHLFWRVSRFTCDTVEALERHLARKLGTDPAATACTQVTRLPGFVYLKSPISRSCGKCQGFWALSMRR